MYFFLASLSLGSGETDPGDADVPSISDALRFRTGDGRRRSDASAGAPPNCTSGESPGVVLINAVMGGAGTRVPLAPADVAAEVGVAVACGEGTVPGCGRVGTRGLCVEERECDSRVDSGECSREETCGARRCRRLCAAKGNGGYLEGAHVSRCAKR